MAKVSVDFSQKLGKIKIMHAVNNGPIVNKGGDQGRGNDQYFREAGIPYCRTHDSAFCNNYGGDHTIDVDNIFRIYDADVNDPNSYDFAMTDKYVQDIIKGGSEVFYRLGSSIEHGVKKYHNIPHQSFQKWAEICEHIIAHYNHGWANGFEYNIKYWEIWNEPDGWEFEPPEKRPTWGGTREQFFDLYCTAAKHLKAKFPEIKIGGPAHGFVMDWAEQLLTKVKEENAPMDFFSWHIYRYKLDSFLEHALEMKELFHKFGMDDMESICDEWNYVEGWVGEPFIVSMQKIMGLRGAAFTAGSMIMMQDAPVDMLMYYDARPCLYNGLFDYISLRPLKGYYPFYNWNKLYKLGTEVKSTKDKSDIWITGATDGKKGAIEICYFPDLGITKAEKVTIDLSNIAFADKDVYITDEKRTNEKIKVKKGNKFTVTLEPNAFVLIETK